MNKEDSLHFAQERLRDNSLSFPLSRDLGLRQRPRVTRRLVAEMAKGEARTFEHVNETVMICCTTGSLWITHDGDPKDVFLSVGQSYRAERDDAMHVFAMQASLLEIEFEDDVIEH
ncbi:MAG TPA: DUF2917 domain-containing protein [Ramlibacter sp.]|jgi:hypothetical protein|nr:DUF2917 domain-containing protein [Ramlibacter sp.]